MVDGPGEADASAVDAPADTPDAPATPDGSIGDPDASSAAADAGGGGGGTAGLGEECGAMVGGFVACEEGLSCCYPCGISGCPYECTVPCEDGPGCSGGCPLYP